jgi:hypothetical protein
MVDAVRKSLETKPFPLVGQASVFRPRGRGCRPPELATVAEIGSWPNSGWLSAKINVGKLLLDDSTNRVQVGGVSLLCIDLRVERIYIENTVDRRT